MANTEIGSAYLSVVARMDKGFSADVITKASALGTTVANIAGKAMDAVASHVDSAMRRVDTLNNFPKVMSSLGVATQESTAAISSMSDHLSSLPTRLDSMASATQQVYVASRSMGVSLGDATKATLGLNDMLLAGGQGAEVAEAAMTQFTQALSKGVPDMQDWKSVVAAAPAQMDQLAKSMLGPTATSTDLYNALKSGKVSMKDMLDQITVLDEQGGEGFDSFSSQAQAATGGLETAMSNMQNAVTKGVANVLQAIGPSNIAAGFDSVKTAINGAFSGAISAIEGFKGSMEESDVGGMLSQIASDASATLPTFDEVKQGFHDAGQAIGDVVANVVAAVRDSGLADSVAGIVDSVQGFADKVSEVLPSSSDVASAAYDAIEAAASALSDALDILSGALDSVDPDVLQTLADVLPAVAAGFLAFQAVTSVATAISALSGAFLAFKTVVDVMGMVRSIGDLGAALELLGLNPAVMAVAGIVAIVTALITLYNTNEDFRNFVDTAWASITETIGGAATAVVGFFQGIPGFFSGLWEGVVSTASGLWNGFVSFVSGIPGAVTGFFSGVYAFFAGLWERVRFVGALAWNAFVGLVMSVPGRVTGFFSGVLAFFAGLWNGVTSTASGIWNGFVSFVSGIPGNIVGFFQSIPGKIDSVFQSAKSLAMAPLNAIKDTAKSVVDGVKGFFDGLHISLPTLSFPSIKLPHFTLSTNSVNLGPLGTVSYPTGMSVSWYARGGYMDSPHMAVMGEAGAEGIVPLEGRHMYPLADAVAERLGGSRIDYDRLAEAIVRAEARVGHRIEVDGREFGRVVRAYA